MYGTALPFLKDLCGDSDPVLPESLPAVFDSLK